MAKSIGNNNQTPVQNIPVSDQTLVKAKKILKEVSKESPLVNQDQAKQIAKKPAQLGKKMVPTQSRTPAMPSAIPKGVEQKSIEAFLARNSRILKELEVKEEDSLFEKALKLALIGKKKIASLLPGKLAQFKGKSIQEWDDFFNNLKDVSTKEENLEYHLSQIKHSIYRGAYQKKGDQHITLIADLHLNLSQSRRMEKFCRIFLNKNTSEILKNLSPGDLLDLDQFKISTLNSMVLRHQGLFLSDEDREKQQKEFLANLKKRGSTENKIRLEDSLIAARKNELQEEKKSNLIDQKLLPPVKNKPNYKWLILFILLIIVVIIIGQFV